MLSFLLIALISLAFYFILFYLRQTLFVTKHRYISSNTLRAYAFLLDMTLLNVINLVFWLGMSLYNAEVKAHLTAVVNTGFHGAGEGLGGFFFGVQFYVLLVYFAYSFICELTGLKSTVLGYFLGLRVNTAPEKSRFVTVLIRSLVKPVSFVLFPLALVLSYSNKERKWFHDLLSGSWVEKVN